jgi:signal transduction histidine kinase
MSLRLKMVVMVTGLIVALGIGGMLHARITLSRISDDELNKRAIAISGGLAHHVAEALLTNDMYGLQIHLNEVAQTNEGLRYIVVLDWRGAIRASTFPGALPAGLREAHTIQRGEPHSLLELSTSEGPILDVAYPLHEGDPGFIRVGIARGPLEQQLNRLSLTLFGLTGVVLVIGAGLSYLFATLLTRPLTRLAEAARALGRGQPSSQQELYSHPEVGQVAVAFDVMTHQLKEKEEERSQLLAKVIAAQEDERKRIARELHDEAGQLLTSLLLGITHLEQSLANPRLQEQASDLRSRTTEALEMMKDMALELRPSTLDDLGLVAALDRYAGDFGRKFAIDVDFQTLGFESVRLDPQTETALYRIVQEALTNVARHSQAKHASVLLERHDDRAVVVVEDDGRGFDVEMVRTAALPSRKLGLLGIEERAALVGGTLTIESRPRAGTAVFVDVPLARERNGHGSDPYR